MYTFYKTCFISHFGIRWIAKGKIINLVHELINELKIFLSSRCKNIDHLSDKIDKEFRIKLAYLADIFELLNVLTRNLRGLARYHITDAHR